MIFFPQEKQLLAEQERQKTRNEAFVAPKEDRAKKRKADEGKKDLIIFCFLLTPS